jgi:nucleolin
MSEDFNAEKLRDSILALLEGEAPSSSSKGEESGPDENARRILTVKKLRKLVFMSFQQEESDKDAKKRFKTVVKELETEKKVSIDSDGVISYHPSGDGSSSKRKKRGKGEESITSKKRSRKQISSEDDVKEGNNSSYGSGRKRDQKGDESDVGSTRNGPCKGNPQGVTRLFLGNLPFAVDEASLGDFLPRTVTHIKWITDKATGKFYGSAFVEMDSSSSAAEAVAMAGSQLLGRPIKINFAPARPGDAWPPEKKVVSGGGEGGRGSFSGGSTTGGQAGGKGIKALGEKPENCVKLFIGNLSYDIDDDGIRSFFASVDAEMKVVRWLHHQTGDFKGW